MVATGVEIRNVAPADLTAEQVVAARRLLRSVEESNRLHKRSNEAVRKLWAVWDDVADVVLFSDSSAERAIRAVTGA